MSLPDLTTPTLASPATSPRSRTHRVLPATRSPRATVSPQAPQWLEDAVFYQIFPERFANGDRSNDPAGTQPWGGTPTRDNFFGGDLEGIREHLDHIQSLGANTLYLTPVFTASTNHRYDGEDYFHIDPALGGDPALDALIADLHRRGMRLVLDGVFNHCGWHHPYFEDVILRGADSPYVNWFLIEDFPVVSRPVPNYKTCSGCEYLPKWNVHNPLVRQHHLRVALHWLERGIDGWRLDVPYFVNDAFWRLFRRTVKERFPHACLIGEEWESPTRWLHGDTFDGTMNYGVRDLALAFSASQKTDAAQATQAVISLQQQIPPHARHAMMNLVGSHDTPRLLQECGGSVFRAAAALALMFTYPGAPMIYYGDEIGLMGENDPGCRGCMPWDQNAWKRPLLEAVRALTRARAKSQALGRGTIEPVFGIGHLLALRCKTDRGSTVTILNRSAGPTVLPHDLLAAQFRPLLSLSGEDLEESSLSYEDGWIRVPGESVIVIEEDR